MCIGTLAAACSASHSTGSARTAPPPIVLVAAAVQQTVPIYGEFVGQTQAANTVEIRSQVQGFLKQIAFREGSRVEQRQLLFLIDPRPYEAALRQAKATLALKQATLNNAQQTVNRYTPLERQHALSKEQLDTAIATAKEDQADVQSADAQVAAAQLNVDNTRIVAPIAGAIGEAQVKVGGLVQAGSTLLDTLYSISPVYITFNVSEDQYLQYVKRGRQHGNRPPPVQLVLADGSVYGEPGTVNMVAPAVSTSTGTLPIRATFPNPSGVLKPGLFARVRLVVQDAINAVLIPQSAVQQLQGTQSVLVVDAGNKVEQRSITVGATVGGWQIVTSGVTAAERVIVEGAQKVRPGIVVEPQPAPALASPAASP